MKNNKLTVVIPQWQGGGQDLCTYVGAYAMKENYLADEPCVIARISTEDISPVKNNILGYDDILTATKDVNRILQDRDPDRIFTLGGGCDADAPCAAFLNQKYDGDLAVVYIDSHGDLNTPESSESKLYYGMSLRALTGECDPQIVAQLAKTLAPDQLILCANRNLDPEETRFKEKHHVTEFTVEEIEKNPAAISDAILQQGYHHVYIHIDLDSLDPAEFSLTPVPEPNGLKCHTLLRIVHEIGQRLDVVGFGILEYSGGPEDKDNALISELVAFGKAM